jgi:hypothetical protein
MNTPLWDRIQTFEFEKEPAEYSFTLRLAKENYWTQAFTEEAILEYKKFMYLAATADAMVSPSPIIDQVWHQHLVYTQSYQEFCEVLGKPIQHVPSTRNKTDAARFHQAKERTQQLYKQTFGNQPAAIWNHADMYSNLKLEKASFKIRTFIMFGILAFIVALLPCYFLLYPVYVKINNPDFMTGYVIIIGVCWVCLLTYNSHYLGEMIKRMDKDIFLFRLAPLEMIYLKHQQIGKSIHAFMNHLVNSAKVQVNKDYTLSKDRDFNLSVPEEFLVSGILEDGKKIFYPKLLEKLSVKPAFTNIVNCMDALKKYIIKSKPFGKLFYLNFTVLAVLFLLGMVRLLTGVVREKPVAIITFFMIGFLVLIIYFLHKLTSLFCRRTLPGYYENDILVSQDKKTHWGWSFFLHGNHALAATFVPLVDYVSRNNDTSGTSSCGTSCGSSCGSSCSSCGGCGGD